MTEHAGTHASRRRRQKTLRATWPARTRKLIARRMQRRRLLWILDSPVPLDRSDLGVAGTLAGPSVLLPSSRRHMAVDRIRRGIATEITLAAAG
jgi:hypothetical protein